LLEPVPLALESRAQQLALSSPQRSERDDALQVGLRSTLLYITGGWGEPTYETENAHSSETTPKNAASPTRWVHHGMMASDHFPRENALLA